MILTIKGADFSGAGIGTNNSIRVQLTKTSGVSGSIVQNNFEKDQVVSTATVIANLAVVSGYENLTVTVTMGGTSVNAWYSNGVVTIPSNTKITGDIKISASATAVSGGEVVDPEPEEPGTGGGSDTPNTITPDTSALRHNLAYSICATDGELLQTNSQFTFKVASDYIEIPSGYIISEFGAVADTALSNVSGTQKPNCYCAFYDSNKVFISSVSPQETDPKVVSSNTWRYTTTPPSIPSNAKYIRVGYNDKLGVEDNPTYIFYGKTSPTLVFTKQ
jgi:hypothetical protein